MTEPVIHGYPDWNRAFAQADVLLFNDTSGSTTDQVVVGPVFCGTSTHLALKFTATGSNCSLLMRFWTDEAMSVVLSSHNFEFLAGDSIEIAVPVLGPWVELLIQEVGGGTLDYSVTLSTAAGPAIPQPVTDGQNVLMSRANTAVGAGATVTTNATRLWPGEAYLGLQCPAATWVATLESVTSALVVTRMLVITNASPITPHRVFLTGEHIRLQFQNTSGAASNFNASLVGRPLDPGR